MLSMNIHKLYRNPNEEKLWRPVLDELTFNKNLMGRVGGHGAGKITGVAGRTVVITGAITGMTRKQMTEVLNLMGATVCDSVSSNTDLLIVGANPGGKKLGAAMRNGTRILPESEFIQLLSSNQ
ncbi:MAG: BRCT domain-containing protein [Spirochaetales bacterium]|nr:BRCT domain-containing protein [Spirochaetales bacterium]